MDLSYHWVNITVVDSEYEALAFSDHLAHVVKTIPPEKSALSISPRARPFFMTSPEVVMDGVFRGWLQRDLLGWQEVRGAGCPPLVGAHSQAWDKEISYN